MPMNQPFIDAFMAGRSALKSRLVDLYDTHADGGGCGSQIRYADVVRATFEVVRNETPLVLPGGVRLVLRV